jgi:hypothetical protein
MACSRLFLGGTVVFALGILGTSLAVASNLETEGTMLPRRPPLKVLVTQHPDSRPRPQWHAVPNLVELQYRGGVATDSVLAAYRAFAFAPEVGDRFAPGATRFDDGWHWVPHKQDFEQDDDRWDKFEHEHEHEHEHPSPVPLPGTMLLFGSGVALLAPMWLMSRRGQRKTFPGRGAVTVECQS